MSDVPEESLKSDPENSNVRMKPPIPVMRKETIKLIREYKSSPIPTRAIKKVLNRWTLRLLSISD